MPRPRPRESPKSDLRLRSPENLLQALLTLDADLTHSRVLLRDLGLPLRPEIVADYERRLAELEMGARLVGLLPPSDVERTNRDDVDALEPGHAFCAAAQG